MANARIFKKALAILLAVLFAVPLFGVATFAEGGDQTFVQLPTSTERLNEGDYWYNRAALANETGMAVYKSATFYRSANEQILKIEYVQNGGTKTELRYRGTDALYFGFLVTMPAFGDPLPISSAGLADGTYWFDKDGYVTAIRPYVSESSLSEYTDAVYSLSADGAILRRTYVNAVGATAHSDELVLDAPGRMCYFLRQVGVDPNAGFVLLPKSSDGLDIGDYWYDAAALAKEINDPTLLDAAYYLSEDGNTLRVISEGVPKDYAKNTYVFDYLKQASTADPNAGFTKLPTSDEGLKMGDYWYDAEGLASSIGSAARKAQYYLSKDCNTLRVIVSGYTQDVSRDDAYADTYFRYLRRAGMNSVDGFISLPTTEDSLREGDYWYNANGLADALGTASYRNALYYLSEDGTVLRIALSGDVSNEYEDTPQNEVYFSFLHQFGMDPNVGYTHVYYTEEEILCRGFCFRIDDYVADRIAKDDAARVKNGLQKYTEEEKAALRVQYRNEILAITFFFNQIKSSLRLDTSETSVVYTQGDGQYEKYAPYIDYYDSIHHDWDAGVVTEPTCEAGGYTTITCLRCGTSYTDKETQMLGHAWDEGVVTEATCTAGGYTTYTCSRCGNTLVTNEVEQLGHAWDDGVVTTKPTCGVPGEKTFTCGRCKTTRTESVAALEHDYNAVVTEPTCEAGGYTTFTCVHCGDSYTDNETKMLGHAWNDGVVTTEPTCTAEGEKTFTCARCKQT